MEPALVDVFLADGTRGQASYAHLDVVEDLLRPEVFRVPGFPFSRVTSRLGRHAKFPANPTAQ